MEKIINRMKATRANGSEKMRLFACFGNIAYHEVYAGSNQK